MRENMLRLFGHLMRKCDEVVKMAMEINVEKNNGKERPKKR